MRSSVDLRARLEREAVLLGVGQDRMISPAETCARWSAETLWARFGITRIGRITNLDRIGIPVWVSVRPNASTLSVCQGKGLDDDAARASAMMEGIEVAVAETNAAEPLRASRRQLERADRRVEDMGIYRRHGQRMPDPDDPCSWMSASDLDDGGERLVPAEAILLDDTREGIYWRSTDGLASGNNLAEALCHGLCERIERDALRLWSLASPHVVREACVDPLGSGDEELCILAERIAEAALTLRLFDITSDVSIPVFFAILFPKDTACDLTYLDVTSGSGAHPSAKRAATRAITEAIQSRLTKIAATRDDFDPSLYTVRLPSDLLIFRDCDYARSHVSSHGWICPRSPNVTCVLEALRAAEIGNLSVVLLADEPGLVVVKALVPGLESPPGKRAFPIGRRLARRMAGVA